MPIVKGALRVCRAAAVHQRWYHPQCVEGGLGPIDAVLGIEDLTSEQRASIAGCCDDPAPDGNKRANYVVSCARAKRMRSCPEEARVRDKDAEEELPPELDPFELGDDAAAETLQNLSWWDSVSYSSLDTWIPTMGTVPPQLHHAVARLKGALCVEKMLAKEARDDTRLRRVWKVLSFIDRLLFASPNRRGKDDDSITNIVTRRVREAWRGNWGGIWQEALRSARKSFQSQCPAKQLKEDARSINAFVKDNLLSKAIARAKGGAVSGNTADDTSKLRSLFPPGSPPDMQGDVQGLSEDFRQKLLVAIQKGFSRFPKRSSPGANGSRFEHWGVVACDEEACQAAAAFILDLLVGDCPEEALRANLGARLMALRKPDGGVRPVAMGSVFRRLGARAACSVLKESVPAAVGRHQYGVGRKAGCELVHKLITALTDEEPSCVVLAFDASNAFNSLLRESIWTATRQRMPELVPVLKAWFNSPTTHRFWETAGKAKFVEAKAGVDQGCPLSPLLFALGIAPVLDDIHSRLQTLDSSCRIFAYLDDIMVVAPDSCAEAAHNVVCDALTRAGLKVNESKTQAWTKDTGTVLAPSVSLKRVPKLKVLGGQIPWMDRDELLTPVHGFADGSQVLQKATHFVTRLGLLYEHGLTVKTAFLALKTYAQSCITHLQRANYENGAWISDLEDLFFQALGNILAWEGGSPEQLSAERRLIAAMTTKEGGLAFGGLPSRSASAFIGSWAMCLADVAKNLQVDSIAGFRARCPSIAHRMDAAEAAAKNNGCFGIRGSMNWQGVLDEAKPKVQSMLGDQIAKANGKKVRSELDDEGIADINTNGGPGAGAFMLPSPPDSKAKTIPSTHFRVLLRDRLLLPVCHPGATCRHRRPDGRLCGEPLDSRGKHARKCKIQGLVEGRHDALRDLNADMWGDHMGVPANTEQRVPQWDRVNPTTGRTEEAKLDIATSDPESGRPLFFDIVVYCAHSDNNARLRALARTAGKAAADAAADKRRRYANAGDALIPLALEAGGRPGEDFVHFVRQMAGGDSAACSCIWHDVSSTLQMHNAELILGANGK